MIHGFDLVNRLCDHIDLWDKCTKCAISRFTTNKVHYRGNITAPTILFIGEAPGKEEDKKGEPFVGMSGKLLDYFCCKYEHKLTGKLIPFIMINVVSCRPTNVKNGSNRPPNEKEIKNCTPRLKAFLDLIDFKAVVSLGRVAENWCINNKIYYHHKFLSLGHPSFWLRTGGVKSIYFKDDLKNICTFLRYLMKKR